VSQKYTVQVNQRALTIIVCGVVCALAGLLAGYWIFSRPALSPSSVPDQALAAAKAGGSSILSAVAPENLGPTTFTSSFSKQYAIDYNTVIKPMGDLGTVTWVGTPCVTWFGVKYIDIALAAHARAGIFMLELRMVRQAGSSWAIDRLLSIQLREVSR
jgi:hypothetical protein